MDFDPNPGILVYALQERIFVIHTLTLFTCNNSNISFNHYQIGFLDVMTLFLPVMSSLSSVMIVMA